MTHENHSTFWHRVFGATTDPIPLESLQEAIIGLVGPGHGLEDMAARRDDQGWFQVDLKFTAAPAITVQRYLSMEEGIRSELNTWAAWLEINAQDPQRWMQHLIETKQVIVFRAPAEGPATLGRDLCRWLAERTQGIYQIDDQGFFTAAGVLVVAEGDDGMQG